MSTRSSRLLRWYRRHRRRLPWREDPRPYNVWLSEIMLQQTQVKTVVPYFERFVERFPDVFSLASADEQDVLAAWSGLGYYRRAKALHRAARILVGEHEGRFPDTVDAWLALPGVGRYTAGAIVSIAFGKPAPILDGNVARVLSRWFAVRGDPRTGAANKTLWRLAEEVLPRRAVSDFNQALMELGALVCLPQNPKCLVCPVRPDCKAHGLGVAALLPELPKRAESVRVTMAAAVIERDGSFLMYRRSEPLMEDLWEFPEAECKPSESPRDALAREAKSRYGIRVAPQKEVAKVRHSVMNRRIELHAIEATLESATDAGPTPRWVSREELTKVPVSSMILKILDVIDRR